jgi:hypothetical protein
MENSRIGLPAAAIALALLCGCATQAQRQFETMRTTYQQASAEIKACWTTIYNSPESAPLRAHLPLDVSDVTLRQLADPSLATREETQAVFAAHARLAPCRRAYVADLAQFEPILAPIYVAFYNERDDDTLALAQRRISWGEYVRRWRDRGAETKAAVDVADQRIVSELTQEDAAERERAAEALKELGNSLQATGTNFQATANAFRSGAQTLPPPPSPPAPSPLYSVQHGDIRLFSPEGPVIGQTSQIGIGGNPPPTAVIVPVPVPVP